MKDLWKKQGSARNWTEVDKKLLHMQRDLRGCTNKDFGSVLQRTGVLGNKLYRLWYSMPSAQRQMEICKVSKELDELLLKEEMMWRQRSRSLWLREGDKNTKYFQRKASWRRKKNTISKLKDEEGVWVEDRSKLQ